MSENETQAITEETPLRLLSKEEIMSADDIETEIVPVPEWGGAVRVKALTGTERDDFENSLMEGSGKMQKLSTKNIRAKLCSLTIVNDKNELMFGMKEMAVLGRKSAAALNRVYKVAAKLSKITDEEVEELSGNSE